MDIPIHVAAAGFVCNVTLYIDSKSQKQFQTRRYRMTLGTACFLFSLFSHLLLDIVPHYDFMYESFIFYQFFDFLKLSLIVKAFAVLLKISILTIPVVILFLYLTKDHLMIALVSIIGGIYPDIEKTAYLVLHIPHDLIIFRNHSCSFSPTGWESEHKLLLIVIEVCLYVALLIGLYWIAHCRGQVRYTGITYQAVFQAFERKMRRCHENTKSRKIA
jgi:hypothetical protein